MITKNLIALFAIILAPFTHSSMCRADNLQCGKDISNLTLFQCSANFGSIIRGWLSSSLRDTMTFANALLEATWTTAENLVVNTRSFILPEADEVIITQGDMVFKDSNVKKQIFVRKGDIAIKFEYWNLKDCVATALRTYHNQRMYFQAVTKLGAILGGTDGTNFLNVPVDVYVSDPIPNETEEDSWRTDVFIFFRKVEGNFTKSIFPNDADYNSGSLWDPQDRNGIIDCTMTEDSVTTTTSVVSIVGSCDDRLIDLPLVVTDFLVTLDSDGSTVSHGLDAPVGNVYTFTGLTAFPHTIAFKNQPDMTTKGYESQATLSTTPA